jgi:carbamoyl-phosphate synthase small subunit
VGTFPDFLRDRGVIAIEGVDTRALTLRIRSTGAMRAAISTTDLDPESLVARVATSPAISAHNFVADVSPREERTVLASPDALHARTESGRPTLRVVAYDCGEKRGIEQGLSKVGCEVTVVPFDTPAARVRSLDPDGVFFSNGPGDPRQVTQTARAAEDLLGNLPVFGICLGHQMICKAAGARMEKLKFGHHGGNQPVVNLLTGRVEITAQNHGFNLVFPSLGEPENESENVSSTHFQNAPAYWENIAENESKIRSSTHWQKALDTQCCCVYSVHVGYIHYVR